jgi:hypothetical protein
MARFTTVLAIAAFAAFASFPSSAADETAESLPDFPGRDDTFGYCIGCHSFKVVGRQGMSRPRWDETLSWMTEKHSMPAPDAEMRKVLLDYLEKAYPAAAGKGGWVNPFTKK